MGLKWRKDSIQELNEVMEVSDRIEVIYDGQLYDGGLHGELTEAQIGLLMTGGVEDAAEK